MTDRVIILGALSAIAEATARLYAKQRAKLVLVARDQARLDEIAADLRARGATEVTTVALDLAAQADHKSLFGAWVDRLGGVSVVLIAYGVLGEQARDQSDLGQQRRILDVNFTSAAAWASVAADVLEVQGTGTLVGIGSVAGDRGRQSNYVYGAAKAGFAVFLQGIAHRLAMSGARAVVIKPGFVDTPMTDGFKKGGPLWAKPEAIAALLVRAGTKGGPIQYAPWFWRFILLVIRTVPSFVFHRTKL